MISDQAKFNQDIGFNRPKKPQAGGYYRCVHDHFEQLEIRWHNRYAPRYTFWRLYFLFNRKLLAILSRCAWKVLSTYLKQIIPFNDSAPGAAIAIYSFGDFQQFNLPPAPDRHRRLLFRQLHIHQKPRFFRQGF
jgi:hypothetical protein